MSAALPVFLTLTLLAIAGCASPQAPRDVAMGGILGTVLVGPTCPVEHNPPDPNCADRPYETDLVATRPDSQTPIKSTRSGPDGKYSFTLAPGQYVVRPAADNNMLPRCADSEPVTVVAGRNVTIDIQCDSGIR